MSEAQPTGGVSPLREMMRHIWPGAMAAQAIGVAAALRIPDLLANGTQSSEELAVATNTHAPTLRRLLLALVSLGMFSETTEGHFANTPMSEALRANHPKQARPWALFFTAPFIWNTLGELQQAVTTGNSVFSSVHGMPFFAYLSDHPEDARQFNAAMSAAPLSVPGVVASYDFTGLESITDIGGGHGALLEEILTRYPKPRGVLFDLPEVVSGVSELRSERFRDRCQIVSGDFFKDIPESDAYILKRILHDWDDDQALAILRNCRKAIKPNGKLLLIEALLESRSEPAKRMLDLLMLVLSGGRERTEDDFRELLDAAGFRITRLIRTPGPTIIESAPF